jgi:uncharacterized membrane protein AbrB (regulator of aidB expression)
VRPVRVFAVIVLLVLAFVSLLATESPCNAAPLCPVDPTAVPFVVLFVALAFVVGLLGRAGRTYLPVEEPPHD